MPAVITQQVRQELEQRIRSRTGRRVRGLTVEVTATEVVLGGRTTSYHVKQLAQHGVRELLPDVRIQNTITVEPVAVYA